MHLPSTIMMLVKLLLLGLIDPIHTYPQPGQIWEVTKNLSSSSHLTSFNVPPQSYNVSAVLTSLVNLTAAFQGAINNHPDNPLLSPLLHSPDISRALTTVQDAIRNTTPVVHTPPFASTATVLGSNLPGSPVVYLRNLSPAPLCYFVEFTAGNFSLPAYCLQVNEGKPDRINGIIVPPNSTTIVYTPANFNGPFNEIIGGVPGMVDGVPALVNGTHGARHEINYNNDQGGVYYDISLEFGFSNSRLGPSSFYPFADAPSSTLENTAPNGGRGYIQGEENILEKANKAWSLLALDEKLDLAKHDRYLTVVSAFTDNDQDGNKVDMESSRLSAVKHDKETPSIVKYFFQMKAGICAYVYHGSAPAAAGIKEDDLEAKMRPVADKYTYFWQFEEGTTKNMTIVAYVDPWL